MSAARGLPQRRHFKFFYRSALVGNTRQEVLLDVVEETNTVHTLVKRPIQLGFLSPSAEHLVSVPTIDSLLRDKLTAFAPTTIGVPLLTKEGLPGDVQQVAKQLFDVGILFDHASDFSMVKNTFDSVAALECGYRNNRHNRNAALDDTWQACLGLTATKKKISEKFPHARLINDGLDRMRGHVTTPEYLENLQARQKLAAKAATLAAHLQAGQYFDFDATRYTGTKLQLDDLRKASLNGTPYDWIDGVRATNPEA